MFDPSKDSDAIGHISSIAWMNLVDSLEKRMTKKEAEALLNRMVDERWLYRVKGRVPSIFDKNKSVKLSIFGGSFEFFLFLAQFFAEPPKFFKALYFF